MIKQHMGPPGEPDMAAEEKRRQKEEKEEKKAGAPAPQGRREEGRKVPEREAENGAPLPEEMELIGKYTRREFRPEELYAFTVALCDNETDRDLERFSFPALERLAALFEGKTGIFNHTPDARHQKARLFRCWTETLPGRKTQAGEPYTRLLARAYLPRGGDNDRLILALESGIQKEVSVSCAVKRQVCSVCGAERSQRPCGHRKGQVYDGKLCTDILEEPTDAYEWSFVAVPAQREAGVVKRFSCEEGRKESVDTVWKEEMEPMELARELRKARGGLRFSGADCEKLAERLERLEKDAAAGRAYRKQLRENIRRLGGLVFPNLEEEALCRMTEGLPLEDLKAVEKAFMGTAERSYPLRPQLGREKKEKEEKREAAAEGRTAGEQGRNPYAI